MRYFLGIDPGAKGAMVLIDENCHVYYSATMSRENLIEVARTLLCMIKREEKEGSSCIACVEKVGAMPGQGVKSMFNFGKNAGYIEGVLESFYIPYQLVPPMTWKKVFGLLKKEKSESITVCKQLLPNLNLLPTELCKKESDGIADAAIMALYAKRKF